MAKRFLAAIAAILKYPFTPARDRCEKHDVDLLLHEDGAGSYCPVCDATAKSAASPD